MGWRAEAWLTEQDITLIWLALDPYSQWRDTVARRQSRITAALGSRIEYYQFVVGPEVPSIRANMENIAVTFATGHKVACCCIQGRNRSAAVVFALGHWEGG